MPSEFELRVDETPIFTVLAVHGEIDEYTAPRLLECLVELINHGHRRVVVDLDRVDFIDSAGLGVLARGWTLLRGNNGELSLVCARTNVVKVLEITGLTTTIPLAPSLDEVAGRADEPSGASP